LVVGSVVFLFWLDILFWHISGLYWYKGFGSLLYHSSYYTGLLFTTLAAPFAA